MAGYDDPGHRGNSTEYHTGKLCVYGCGRPAGTAWSKLYCFECNVARINRINESVEKIVQDFKLKQEVES